MNNNLDISFIKPKHDKPHLFLPSSGHPLVRNQSHKQKLLDTSIHSNVSDILRLLNENNNKHEIVPFGDYISTINETMAKYQSDRNSIIKDIIDDDDIKTKISKEEANNITKLLRQNKNRVLTGATEDSLLKIKTNESDNDYSSPYESLRVLKRNRVIHDAVSQNFLQRQKDLTDEAVQKFESYSMKYRVKMPKIRICPILPKTMFDMMRQKEEMEEDELYELEQEDANKSRNRIGRNNKKKTTMRIIPAFVANSSQFKLFAYYRYANKNFPEGREQFSLSSNFGDIVLVGGIGSNIKNNNVPLSGKGSIRKTFLQIRAMGTQLFYTRRSSDFEIFNLEDRTWSSPMISSRAALKLRRNHIAELIGNQMLIHGGISETGECLNDTFLLNLSPLKWFTCSISIECTPPALFGHASALVVQSEVQHSPKFNIYKYPEIKERGLYIFGGKTKEDGGIIKNDLWILSVGRRPAEWFKPECRGIPPPPRYYHTMNYYEGGNMLIVHGGRNDSVSDSFALNDTYILNLGNLEWNEINLYSWADEFRILSRCGHSATICCKKNKIILANKLFIFGGLNSSNYIGASFFVINLDFYYKHTKKTGDEEKAIEETLKISGHINPETRQLLDKIVNQTKKNQISIVPEITLPDIK